MDNAGANHVPNGIGPVPFDFSAPLFSPLCFRPFVFPDLFSPILVTESADILSGESFLSGRDVC